MNFQPPWTAEYKKIQSFKTVINPPNLEERLRKWGQKDLDLACRIQTVLQKEGLESSKQKQVHGKLRVD